MTIFPCCWRGSGRPGSARLSIAADWWLATLVVVAGRGALLGILAGDVVSFLGALFLIALGLGLFNAHQVVLVVLVAWLGPRLPLPTVTRQSLKAGLAFGLAVAAFGLAIAGTVGILSLIYKYNAGAAALVQACLCAMPLLTLPCYMLAHDLETGAREVTGSLTDHTRLAVALRWASGVLYPAFVLIAFGLSFRQALAANGNSSPADATVLLGMIPALLYLAVAPLPVLAVLAGLGGLQRWLTPAAPPREAT